MAKRYSKEDELKIVRMYKEGINTVEIANLFNTYNTTIRRILIRNNIKLISISERLRKVEPNHFDDYLDPEVQYWIGVLAADGCLTNGNLVLAVKDEEWVTQFRNFLNPSININLDPHEIWRVSVRCKGLNSRLTELYNLTENKSLDLKLKCKFTPHLLRGIIDGDGGWTAMRVRNNGTANFNMRIGSGSLDFINQCKTYLEELGFSPTLTSTIKNRKNRFYTVSMFKQSELKTLINILYNDLNQPFLIRKHTKIGSFFTEK